MEIQTLLNFLTTNGFGIPTTFILIFLSILKLRPITFFTATGFERKLFSKEADAIYILYYYFISCVFITFMLLGFTIISIGIPFNINLGLILFYLSVALFFCLTETTYTRPFIEKRINQKTKQKIKKYAETLVNIYLLFLMFSVVYFFGKTLLLSFKSELTVTSSNIQLFLDNFIAFTILYLMLSVLLLLMFRKLFQT
ncbi:MAG TPA: hypothetical protein GXX18_02365 [Bacillales bacterium]|nr:hypothetical protein [Bacillales bacterium]